MSNKYFVFTLGAIVVMAFALYSELSSRGSASAFVGKVVTIDKEKKEIIVREEEGRERRARAPHQVIEDIRLNETYAFRTHSQYGETPKIQEYELFP